MSDSDELPEAVILEFEKTIRRLADEHRLPSFERFKQVMLEAREEYRRAVDAAPSVLPGASRYDAGKASK
jgi:hypothetical protein